MLNLHAWNVYMGILCVCTKLMKNDVIVVCSWLISWLIVVVVMECVVDELMPWVFIIMDWWCELGCCWGCVWLWEESEKREICEREYEKREIDVK